MYLNEVMFVLIICYLSYYYIRDTHNSTLIFIALSGSFASKILWSQISFKSILGISTRINFNILNGIIIMALRSWNMLTMLCDVWLLIFAVGKMLEIWAEDGEEIFCFDAKGSIADSFFLNNVKFNEIGTLFFWLKYWNMYGNENTRRR